MKADVTTSRLSTWHERALPCTVYPGWVCTTMVVDCSDTYARGVGDHHIRGLSIGDVAAYMEFSPHRKYSSAPGTYRVPGSGARAPRIQATRTKTQANI